MAQKKKHSSSGRKPSPKPVRVQYEDDYDDYYDEDADYDDIWE